MKWPSGSGADLHFSGMNLAINTMLPHSYKSDSPGATVIVTDHGAVVFRKAYGLANVAENVALDPWMSLRVGSITKQFTAAAIMLLAEKGKLALSDKICFLRNTYGGYAAFYSQFRIANSQSVRSGFRSQTYRKAS